MALTPVFWVVCGLLVVAGGAKAASPAAAAGFLRALGVPVPNVAVRALGAVELVIGIWGGLSPSTITGALVAATYAAFCGAHLAGSRGAGGASDCGCFGSARSRPGALHVALNAAACVIALLVALEPSRGLPWMFTRSPLVSVTLAIGASGAAFAAFLAYTVVPDAWRAYRPQRNAL